jgi:hypothetical protein
MKIDDYKKILAEHELDLGANHQKVLKAAIEGKPYKEIAKDMGWNANQVATLLSKVRAKYIKKTVSPTKNSPVRIITPPPQPQKTIPEKTLLEIQKSGKYILLITDDKAFVESLIKGTL